jgi:AcrR family transcriptional regulator
MFLYLVNSNSDNERSRPRLRERLREATVREILSATEATLAEAGLEQATMARIAERAGVAVGTLYNRFADRDALIEALLLERRSDILNELDASMTTLATASFREQLAGFFTTLFTHVEQHRPFMKLVFSREIGQQVGRERMSRSMFERLESILARGKREELLRTDVDQSFAVILLGSAKGMMLRDGEGVPALPPEAAARSLVDLFLDGAGKEPQ